MQHIVHLKCSRIMPFPTKAMLTSVACPARLFWVSLLLQAGMCGISVSVLRIPVSDRFSHVAPFCFPLVLDWKRKRSLFNTSFELYRTLIFLSFADVSIVFLSPRGRPHILIPGQPLIWVIQPRFFGTGAQFSFTIESLSQSFAKYSVCFIFTYI